MEEILSVLTPYQTIEAVSVGGSRGLCLGHANSDYDVVVHRRDIRQFKNEDLIFALERLGAGCVVNQTTSLISASLSGKNFEFFLKDLAVVEREVEQAQKGNFKWFLKPLFPHGDLSTTVLSHLVHLDCLFDRSGSLSQLRASVTPMPPKLTASLLKYFVVQMDSTVIHALKVTKYADLQYLIALVSQFVFFFNILMFAVNEAFPVLEKGGATLLRRLPVLPLGYDEPLRALLPVDGTINLQLTHEALKKLNSLVQAMVKKKLSELAETGV